MRQRTNTWQRIFVIWLFALLVVPVATHAEGENHDPSLNHKADMTQDDSEDSAPVSPPSPQEQQPVNFLTPPGQHHHYHRPPLLSPDEDRAYSELNHHIAGVFVLLAGGLALLAAANNDRFLWARYGWPGLFFFLGVFLLLRHDPESWPRGWLSLQESLGDVQIVQHMLFTCIVLAIGIVEWLRHRGTLTHSMWGLIFPALAVSAAFMLFAHKHGEGPSADKIYRHHSIMAVSGIIAMIAKVLDDTGVIKEKFGSYTWSGLIMFVGLMLLLYSE